MNKNTGILFLVLLFCVSGIYSQQIGIKKNHMPGLHDAEERSAFYGEFKPDNIFGAGLNANSEPRPSNVFNFESIDNSVISQLNTESNLFAVELEGRELPLAIYFSRPFLNMESPTIESRIYGVLSDKAVMEKMKVFDASEFHIVDIATDELGIVHVKLNQHFRNRAVFGGQIYVHLYDNMSSSMINGKWFKDPRLGISSRNIESDSHHDAYEFIIAERAVKDIIKRDMGNAGIEMREHKCSGNCVLHQDQLLSTVEQIVIEEVFFPCDMTGDFIPVFEAIVSADLLHRYKYIINAQNGDIIRKQNEHCTLIPEGRVVSPEGGIKVYAKDLHNVTREIDVWEQGGQQYMIDISRPMFKSATSNLPGSPDGVIMTLDANFSHPNKSDFNSKIDFVRPSNNIWDPIAVSAHYNAGITFEYFLNKFGRNSWDGQGGNLFSIINLAETDGSGMDNAFWAGNYMAYGNGNRFFSFPLAKALDITGHELGHGVIQTTANLEYYGESGAINEGYADIFGSMIDRDNWTLAEDVINPQYFPTGAMRDMSNPHNGGPGTNGWQPSHYDERYTGKEDNGGVHINSGIINFAYYKFATAVGKDKAEQVFYRALAYYLTKSSDFKDLRLAIETAANDLYGASAKTSASAAFEAVGIKGSAGGTGTDKQQDLKKNPGSDYFVCTDVEYENLYLFDAQRNQLAVLSSVGVYSKPSVTDDGRHIVWVGNDLKIHYIYIDWEKGEFESNIINTDPVWRNAVLSKDGTMLAALTHSLDNKVYVYSYILQEAEVFELYTPTTAEGVDISTVEFADILEFDYSGEWIMYDCYNSVSSGGFFDIEYWDIGFVNVWNNQSQDFSDGRVEKLFSGLDEEVHVGNPVFSKNSPYVIAFDYNRGSDYAILGANLEVGDIGTIYVNENFGAPSYNSADNKVIFDYDDFFEGEYLAVVDLDNTKINQVPNTANYFLKGARWGVWFSNGIRDLKTSVYDLPGEIASQTDVYPNPASDIVYFDSRDFNGDLVITIHDILGNVIYSSRRNIANGKTSLDVSSLKNGNYFIRATDGKKLFSGKIIVIRN